MYRHSLYAVTLITVFLLLTACAANNNAFRPGRDLRADLGQKRSAKFILGIGQRGYLDIEGQSYGFELIRINSTTNVTIELLAGGETVTLSAQLLKKVALSGDGPRVTFELSTVVREATIIYVYAEGPQTSPGPAEAAKAEAPGPETIRLHLRALEDTTVTLALDDKDSQAIPLPKGTEVSWEATRRAEITLPDARKVIFEINGVIHQPAQGTDSLHTVVQRRDGRLVVESR